MSATPMKPLPPANRILANGWAKEVQAGHVTRLAAVRSIVNSSAPISAKVKLAKIKQKIAADANNERIDRENRMLLQRMSDIQSKPSTDLPQVTAPTPAQALAQARQRSLNSYVRAKEQERIAEENLALVARLKRGRGNQEAMELERHEREYTILRENGMRARLPPAALPHPKFGPLQKATSTGSQSDRLADQEACMTMPMRRAANSRSATSLSSPHQRAAAGLAASASSGSLLLRRKTSAGPLSPTVPLLRPLEETQDQFGPVEPISAGSYPAFTPRSAQASSQYTVQVAKDGRKSIDGRSVIVSLDEMTAEPEPQLDTSAAALASALAATAAAAAAAAASASASDPPASASASSDPASDPSTSSAPASSDPASSSSSVVPVAAPAALSPAPADAGVVRCADPTLLHCFLFRTFDARTQAHDYVTVPYAVIAALPECVLEPHLIHEPASRPLLAERLFCRLRFHAGRLAFNPSHALKIDAETVQQHQLQQEKQQQQQLQHLPLQQQQQQPPPQSQQKAHPSKGDKKSSSSSSPDDSSTWDHIGSDGHLHAATSSPSSDLDHSSSNRSSLSSSNGGGNGGGKHLKPLGTHHLSTTLVTMVRAGQAASTSAQTIAATRAQREKKLAYKQLLHARARSTSPMRPVVMAPYVPRQSAIVAAATTTATTDTTSNNEPIAAATGTSEKQPMTEQKEQAS